jgi:hypothetical protein
VNPVDFFRMLKYIHVSLCFGHPALRSLKKSTELTSPGIVEIVFSRLSEKCLQQGCCSQANKDVFTASSMRVC